MRELPPFRDALLCGISTQLHQQVQDFDELITAVDEDFTSSGLLADSLVRLGFLAVIPQKRLLGSIGSIAPSRRRRLLQNLIDHLSE